MKTISRDHLGHFFEEDDIISHDLTIDVNPIQKRKEEKKGKNAQQETYISHDTFKRKNFYWPQSEQ